MFAAVATISVEVPEPVTEVGLNVPVAPVGRPLTVKSTAALKPFAPVTVGVKVVLPPWTTVCELGEAVSEKLGGAVTFRATSTLCVRLQLVPVTVTTYDPTGVAPESVVMVRVEDPDAIWLGLKVATAPAGKPVALSETFPLNPFTGVMVAI